MPNRISKYQVLAQLGIVTSGGTWVKARWLKDRNPFTQQVVQQATYVRLQGVAFIVSLNTATLTERLDGCRILQN